MHKQSKIQNIYINTNQSNEDRQLQNSKVVPLIATRFFMCRINIYI